MWPNMSDSTHKLFRNIRAVGALLLGSVMVTVPRPVDAQAPSYSAIDSFEGDSFLGRAFTGNGRIERGAGTAFSGSGNALLQGSSGWHGVRTRVIMWPAPPGKQFNCWLGARVSASPNLDLVLVRTLYEDGTFAAQAGSLRSERSESGYSEAILGTGPWHTEPVVIWVEVGFEGAGVDSWLRVDDLGIRCWPF